MEQPLEAICAKLFNYRKDLGEDHKDLIYSGMFLADFCSEFGHAQEPLPSIEEKLVLFMEKVKKYSDEKTKNSKLSESVQRELYSIKHLLSEDVFKQTQKIWEEHKTAMLIGAAAAGIGIGLLTLLKRGKKR